MADRNGLEKKKMLQKLIEEACSSSDWDMSDFFQNLHVSSIPASDLTALIYVGNLSQRQYQMCRILLVKHGVKVFRPRCDIDSYKKSLNPSVDIDTLSAAVDVTSLLHSILHAILSSESLHDRLNELKDDCNIEFIVKAELDGWGSHKKRQQLSGDKDDDNINGSENFLSVFMTPIKVTVEKEILWENPAPNSIFYTRPIQLVKAKSLGSW